MTISQAIQKVLAQRGKPMTAAEIHAAIVAGSLFEFKSKSAASIVRSQIRRHCEGVSHQNAASSKLFKLVDGDRYELISGK